MLMINDVNADILNNAFKMNGAALQIRVALKARLNHGSFRLNIDILQQMEFCLRKSQLLFFLGILIRVLQNKIFAEELCL